MLAKTDQSVAFTDKIRRAIGRSGAAYATNFGWDLEFYPSANMVIVNIPVKEGSLQEQYCMNTITGAWGRFKDIDANCFAISGGDVYFGGNTVVGKFWSGEDDNGNNIRADLKPAFNYFNSRGRLKHFKEVRPIFLAGGTPEVSIGLNVDYRDDPPTQNISFVGATAAGIWDTGLWDTFTWGGEEIFADWETVGDVGTSATLRMIAVKKGATLKLQAIDYLYERGGVIG